MELEQAQTAATMKAQGASYQAIANALEIPKSTAYRYLQKDQINQLIKQAQTNLIQSALETAVNNQVSKIKAGSKITQAIENKEEITAGSVKLMELAHDSEKQLLQSVGIHNAHTQSIQLTNILIDNRSSLSPAIESLLTRHLLGENIQDAEYAKVEGNEGQSQSIGPDMATK